MMATTGDWLIVESAHTGEPRRKGMILEVHGASGAPPYFVRWTDTDHETLVFPGPDARIEPAEHAGTASAAH